MKRSVLVVATQSSRASKLCAWIRSFGCDTVVASSYAAGKQLLHSRVDLLVTEVKLADYNGMQLALRARASAIPTVVLGPDDAVLRRDSAALGALYVSGNPRKRAIAELLAPVLLG